VVLGFRLDGAYVTPLCTTDRLGRHRMQLVTLQVEHACPVSTPIRGASGIRAMHFFHRTPAVSIEVRADEARSLEHVVRLYQKRGGQLIEQDPRRLSAIVRFRRCPCCDAGRVVATIERTGHQYLPPVRYDGEGERYQFMVLRGQLDRTLWERLPSRVRVTGVRARPLGPLGLEEGLLVPWSSVVGDMTARQRAALVSGISAGYFATPRRIGSDRLAGRFGISRPAFDKLLRRAEEHLMQAVRPYLTDTEPGRDRAERPGAGRSPHGRSERPGRSRTAQRLPGSGVRRPRA
jgi:predicted DNA binding protein